MPKIKPLLEVDRLDNSFRHILAVQMAEYEIKTMSELSERANIKRSTLYRKMRSPGTFLTIELRTLRRVLHISKEQFAEMLGARWMTRNPTISKMRGFAKRTGETLKGGTQ